MQRWAQSHDANKPAPGCELELGDFLENAEQWRRGKGKGRMDGEGGCKNLGRAGNLGITQPRAAWPHQVPPCHGFEKQPILAMANTRDMRF